IAFLGPLVGSLSRPLGGLLADKIGGAIVTFWNFIAMGAATIGVMYFVDIKDFAGFLTMFLILFVHDRDRQRLDLSNDSGDLPRGDAQEGERLGRGRPGARLEGGESRGRRRAGIYRCRRRLRWLPDPARIWRLDRRHGQSAPGIGNLPGILRHLHSAHVVVLPAQKSTCVERAEPRRSAGVRRA